MVRGSSPVPSMATSSRAAGSAAPSRSAHSTSVTPVGLPLVEQPAGERVRGVGEAVQVEVEQRQAALVLGHQHEARGVDDVGHAEPGAEPLGELRLARAELADEAEQIARLGDAREAGGERSGDGGIIGPDDDRDGGGRFRGYRATPSGAVRDCGTESFEIRQRQRDRSGLVEAHPAALELRAGLEPTQPREALHAALAPVCGPCFDAHAVRRPRRQDEIGRVPHDRGRIDDRDVRARPAPRTARSQATAALAAWRPRARDRRTAGRLCSAARWRRSDASSRAGPCRQRRHHDPAHAHRPGARERLGVDAGADHEDRPRSSDVDASRPQLAGGVGREVEPAVRRLTGHEDAGHRPPADPDGDPGAGRDIDHLARERRGHGVAVLARHEPPLVAAGQRREQLAIGPCGTASQASHLELARPAVARLRDRRRPRRRAGPCPPASAASRSWSASAGLVTVRPAGRGGRPRGARRGGLGSAIARFDVTRAASERGRTGRESEANGGVVGAARGP